MAKTPVSFKFNKDLLKRAKSFAENQPVKPSLTAVVEAALRLFLDAHDPDAKRKK